MGKSIWDTRFGKQKKALAFDECLKVAGWAIDDWITVHPNGPDNLGRHVELDGEGRIINGMGGVHNGKKLSEIGIKSAFPKEYHGEETNPDNIDNPHFVDRVWGYNAEIKENERKAAEAAKQAQEKQETPEENQGKQSAESTSPRVKLTAASLPAAFTKTRAEAANTEKLLDFINSQEGVNPDVLELLNNAGEIMSGATATSALELKHGYSSGRFQYGRNNSTLSFPKIDAEPPTGQAETTIHELAHALDLASVGERPENISVLTTYTATALSQDLNRAIRETNSTISDEAKAIFKEKDNECAAMQREALEKFNTKQDEILDAFNRKEISATEANKQINAAAAACRKEAHVNGRNIMGGAAALEDIYDALSGGRAMAWREVSCGHGLSYYSDPYNVSSEIFANFVSMSVIAPEYVEVLRRDKPELVAALERQVREMNAKVKARKAG